MKRKKFQNIVRSANAAAGAAAARRPRRVTAHGRVARPSQRTRAQLIEVAGRVFAEQGFDGATGQGICRRAGVNNAAIVYHFGGMAGLHRAVLEEAQRRLVTTEALAAAVNAERNPRRQLEAFVGLIVRALTSPVSQSWAGRLFSREWVTPSTVYGPTHDRALAARARTLKSIVSALTGHPANHPLVARGCISVMAPCALLLLVNRRKLQRLMPQLNITAESAPQITRHLVDFALAGLRAISGQRTPQ
jgi:TetR/AcrR family transcriptional regulator, regulator of cefoperazone and chloramphenicol sensitivity